MIPRCDGFLVLPGGFGKRGSEGKILYIKNAREKQIPFFGYLLRIQMAIVEYTRNFFGLDVYSAEIKPQAKTKIIEIMEEQKIQKKPFPFFLKEQYIRYSFQSGDGVFSHFENICISNCCRILNRLFCVFLENPYKYQSSPLFS